MSHEDNEPDPLLTRDNLGSGVRVAAWATVITLALALSKGVIGQLRGSPALVADAVHSGADTVAILASWIGLKLASRPPTKRFPFGLYKVETLASLLVSGVILWAGIELLTHAIQGLTGGAPLEHRSIDVLAVSLASAVISFGIYRWEKRVGHRLQSQSLLANADESRVDILSSMLVFTGATATYFSVPYVERVVAAALSLLILWLGLKHGRVALYSLLDASLDPELERRVATVAVDTPGVLGVEKVRLRRSGPVRYGIVHVELRPSTDVVSGHEVAHRVERRVRQALPQVEMLTVHIEPHQPEQRVVAVPVQERDTDAEISHHFGRARFFAIAIVQDGSWRVQSWEKNTVRKKPSRAGLAAIKEVLQSHRVDAVLTCQIGEIAFHSLRGRYIEVYGAASGTAAQALDRFAHGEQRLLSGPTHPSEAAGGPQNEQGTRRDKEIREQR